MRQSHWRVLAVLAACAAVAGCGGGSSAQDTVKSTFLDTAKAMANADGITACANFDPAVTKALTASTGTTCPNSVSQLAASLSSADRSAVASTTVAAVTVAGSRATITYRLNSGLRKLGFTGTSRLVQSGGKWLIAPRNGA